ncbi:MAG: AIM24 family protein [Ruminococcus sp.]|nr:AIM24 family protein [Ruminococcus sp.]
MNIKNLTNNNRIITSSLGNFSVLEYGADLSLSPVTAQTGFFMSKMGVRRRQVIINLDGSNTAVLQAGAMQWMLGDINVKTNVKGVGDFMGKMFKGAVTKESAVKPEYSGIGTLALEPTYKFIILQDVSQWSGGMVIEDGMFLACDGSVDHTIVTRKNASSAILGGEGLFNLCLSGKGIAALESNVPMAELVEIELNNETIKIDGSLALCWSAGLDFTVEKSTGSLLGSAVSGEGLVNVYRGTGKLLMSPVAATKNFMSATSMLTAKP